MIRLVDTTEEPASEPPPAEVPVPTRLPRSPHPLVAAARSQPWDGAWIDNRREPGVAHVMVSKGQLQRALRLLQAMLTEGQRRGHPVECADRSGACAGGAGLLIHGEIHELVVIEERRRVATDPNKQRRPYEYVPPYELVPTGHLRLDLGHSSFVAPLATDRKRWRIEDRLGQAFQRLEHYAAETEERRLEREAREQEREARRQQDLRDEAERQQERARVDDLIAQVHAWRLATDIDDFVAAVRTSEPERRLELEEWLDWASSVAERADPLRGGPLGPQ